MVIQPWIKNILNLAKPVDTDNPQSRNYITTESKKHYNEASRTYIGTQWKVEGHDLRDVLKKFRKIVPLLIFINIGRTTTEKTGRVQIITRLTATRTENTVTLASGKFGLTYSEIGTFGRVSQIKLYYSGDLIYDQDNQGYKKWPGTEAIRDTPPFIVSLANIALEFRERAEFIEDHAKQREKALGVKMKK